MRGQHVVESGRRSLSGSSLTVLIEAGRVGDMTDGELLRAAASAEENQARAEAAFAALIARHGPMVLRTCRAILRDVHESEDAFQATFLLLVRDARIPRARDTIGPWLHGVAVRVSRATCRARITRLRRLSELEVNETGRSAGDLSPIETAERNEAAERLHAEIGRLPERFRTCLVLCDLEGMSYAQASQSLGVPIGTVQSRLSRARQRLRTRLMGRSTTEMYATSAVGLAAVRPFVPAALLNRTASLCVLLASSPGKMHPALGPTLATMMKGASHMRHGFSLARLGGLLAVSALAGSLMVYSQTTSQKAHGHRGRERHVNSSRVSRKADSPRGASLAPYGLEASASRGKLLVYELDRDGNRMLDGPEGPGGIENQVFKEAELETSWALVIGVVPNRAILKDARLDWVSPEVPNQFYRRVELSRQERKRDGSWSEWQPVDPAPTVKILDNLPEEEEELLPPEYRPDSLVDPLPYRTDRHWSRVNPERLLVTSRDEAAHATRPGYDPATRASLTSSPELSMLRSLDFSVVSGKTYRYRSRLVVSVRMSNRQGEKAGEWSQTTEAVTVP